MRAPSRSRAELAQAAREAIGYGAVVLNGLEQAVKRRTVVNGETVLPKRFNLFPGN